MTSGDRPRWVVHESSRIARIPFIFVKIRVNSWTTKRKRTQSALREGVDVAGGLRAAKEKRNPFRFERKRWSSFVEAVRKPLLLWERGGRLLVEAVGKPLLLWGMRRLSSVEAVGKPLLLWEGECRRRPVGTDAGGGGAPSRSVLMADILLLSCRRRKGWRRGHLPVRCAIISDARVVRRKVRERIRATSEQKGLS